MWEQLIPMLSGLFKGGAGSVGASGGGLMDLLSKGSSKMGGANSAMSGQVAGAVLPQTQFGQHMTGSPTSTNPMMSSTIGAGSAPPSMGSGGGGKKWEEWATPQDTSAGLVAGQPNDPMYGQMMQQVMQQQQPQQQRQPMTSVGVAQLPQTGIPQATMPKMPGAIHPNEDMMSLFRRLMGGA
jgi:hypothetical protein